MTTETTYTQKELDAAKEQAVVSAKVEKFDGIINEIFVRLRKMDKDISDIPMQIIESGNRTENDLKRYMHENFVTIPALNEVKMEIKGYIRTGSSIITVVLILFELYNRYGA